MRCFLCGWITGILIVALCPALYPLPLLSCLALIWAQILHHWCGKHPNLRTWLLFTGALILGLTHAGESARQRLTQRLDPALDHQLLMLSGTIISLVEGEPHRVHFRFAPDSPIPGLPTPLSLNFTQPGPAPLILHPGQRWYWACRLRQPHTQRNPGGFDGETWAWSENIRAMGQIGATPSPRYRGYSPFSLKSGGLLLLIEEWRDKLRQHLIQQLGPQRWSAVLLALTLGDQSLISDPDWQLFWATGVGHLVSISGLHITMLAGLIGRITRCIHPSIRWRWATGLGGATAYSLIAGFSLPTQRTLTMIAVATAGRFLQRPLPVSTLLLLAASATLLGDPMAPLSNSFWLSFSAVAWLVYAESARTGKSPFWHELTHTQWAATWSTLPLSIWLFGQVSWVAPLANAFAIPLVSLGVVPLALAGMLPGLTFCLFWAESLFEITGQLLQWLIHQGGAPLPFPSPSLPLFLSASLGTAFLLAPRGLPGRWAGSLGILGLFLSPSDRPAHGDLRLDILDVGQGLAVVVTTATHTLIVDTGPGGRWAQDTGSRVLIPYLRSQGIDHLDGLLLSHGDLDHSGGTRSLLQSYPVPWAISSLPPNHALWRSISHRLACHANMSWQWDDIRFDILYPNTEAISQAKHSSNDQSCVLRISHHHQHILLPGDIEEPAERELLDTHPHQLRATVLIVPHHGSRTSSTPEFLAAVQPRWSLFSVGYHNRFHHPNTLIWQRYGALPSQRWRTDECGALTVTLQHDHFQISALRNQWPHYWEPPCPEP